uniref:CRAL-TRIO domain-containing protein n=1 Tax=Phytophthora ramorum TaxID=164328 RepID=H3GBM9_PHYRM
MDIGRVLLRDAHYVWHERVALLEKDAVALQCPPSAWQAAAAAVTRSSKKTKAKPKQKPKPKLLPKQRSKPKAPPPAELLPLDGSFSCEGIVVSSAHMHSVRLQDLRSGREFLVDATTKGKKHMWIDLFSNARSRAHISSNWGGEGSYIDAEDAGETARTIRTLTLLDVQQAVEMLVTATESDAEAAVVRGCDVENILLGEGSAADFTASEAAELARKLVEEDVLLPFCCSCSFGYRVDRVYQINADHRLVKEAQLNEEYVEEVDREDGSGRCRGHLLWLHDSAFQDLLAQFDGHEDDEEGVSGTDGVQLLLRFGAYSVPTALALANELLHHELIVEGYSSDDESLDISFQMNTTARRGSAQVMRQESLGRAVIVLTRAEEAEVHSFRLAIAQAAGAPVETTHVFSDEYIFSVLRVKNRSFAYAVTKMARIIKWRRIYEVDAITWDDVKSQLTSGSMYWYGYDFQNRPILWVRAKLKDWTAMSSRRDVEVRAHVYLLELGCRLFMPPGVTTYTIVTDSAGLGMAQVDLRLMRGLLDVCVANFPDRIGLVHAGPLTRFLKYVTSWLWPFLPVRLRSKVSLMHDCTAELAKHMDTDLIPLHMGGSAMHNLRTPVLNPTEADDIMEITYMIDQQKRFMEELKIQH